jgi:hypothetical protein
MRDNLARRKNSAALRVGDPVWVVVDGWDFVYFSRESEPATITRIRREADGRVAYDGIEVRFDRPRQRWADSPPLEIFNFEPDHLVRRGPGETPPPVVRTPR